MNLKTIKELWVENGNTSKGLFIKSHTNKTSKYRVIIISDKKNHAIVCSRGKGFRGWFKKYHTTFVLDNPRWIKV